MADPVLRVEEYSFWYGGKEGERTLALEDVSFEVEAGDFVLILGASGSGKSTLALNLVGIYPDYFGGQNKGRILVRHPERGLVNRRELTAGERFKTVNMLFQNPEDQVVTLSVSEEVAFALENYLVPPAEIPAKVTRALELVRLQGFQERSTLKLSGGEKQRLALAAMLALEPSVLILDEPTSNLDPAGTEEVLRAVNHVRQEVDLTLMIVEHEVDEVYHQVDKVILVDGKRVHGPYPPRDFLARHGLDVRDRMGLWIPQSVEVGLGLGEHGLDLPTTPLTGRELVESVQGEAWAPTAHADAQDGTLPQEREGGRGAEPPTAYGAEAGAATAVDVPPEISERPRGETVIEVRGLRFSYPTRSDVLRGIDLDIRRGELLALVGQNGSGKSTVAAHLNGLLKPTAGEVRIDGRPSTDYKFADLAKRVAYIFQMPEKQFIRGDVFHEMAHGLRALGLGEEEVRERVEHFLETVNLAERKEASPYVLSHGQKRRLSVACMVISDPDVVVLDEPTFGQDWRQAQNLMQFMRGLADRGAAVTFITHDMRLVSEYADRCAALADGEKIFDGTPLELFGSPELLRRARLKPPPIHSFSREIVGDVFLSPQELVMAIKERTTGGKVRAGV